MAWMFQQDEKLCRIEIYNEYLKKIPQLLKQIESLEKMVRKAEIEAEMLRSCNHSIPSVEKYQSRIDAIQTQGRERLDDLKEELDLILRLKEQIETEIQI